MLILSVQKLLECYEDKTYFGEMHSFISSVEQNVCKYHANQPRGHARMCWIIRQFHHSEDVISVTEKE